MKLLRSLTLGYGAFKVFQALNEYNFVSLWRGLGIMLILLAIIELIDFFRKEK